MVGGVRTFLPAVLGAVLLLACSDAPSSVQGGEYIYEGGPPSMVSADDGGGDAIETPDVMLPPGCQAGGASAGSTWTDLYTCYFGPMGVASCTAFSVCHVTNGVGGGIWLCGTDQATCYSGIKTQISGNNAMQTFLYGALHKANPGSGDINNMPATQDLSGTSYTFTTDDLMRISSWIQGGAPNN